MWCLWQRGALVTSFHKGCKNAVAYINHSGSSGFATQPLMHQHLQQGLVSDTPPRRQFSRFCDIGFGQAERYLNARRPVQLADEPRALSWFLHSSSGILLHKITALAAPPPVRLFRFVCEFWNCDPFLFHPLFPLQSPGNIVLFLSCIQTICGDDPNLLASLHQNNGEQSSGVRFAVNIRNTALFLHPARRSRSGH